MPIFRGQLNDFDRFPFGAHKGELLMDVPDGYYRWLQEQDWLHEWPALQKYVEAHDWGEDDDEEEPYERDDR